MNKIAKAISSTVMAGVMTLSLAVSASAECSHGTWVATVRAPYHTTATTHDHKIGEYTEGGIIHKLYKECTITTKYGMLYQSCKYCGKIMDVRQTSLGTTHSVRT